MIIYLPNGQHSVSISHNLSYYTTIDYKYIWYIVILYWLLLYGLWQVLRTRLCFREKEKHVDEWEKNSMVVRWSSVFDGFIRVVRFVIGHVVGPLVPRCAPIAAPRMPEKWKSCRKIWSFWDDFRFRWRVLHKTLQYYAFLNCWTDFPNQHIYRVLFAILLV